jgi:hypothetical protein
MQKHSSIVLGDKESSLEWGQISNQSGIQVDQTP